jgi:hypothetical protein
MDQPVVFRASTDVKDGRVPFINMAQLLFVLPMTVHQETKQALEVLNLILEEQSSVKDHGAALIAKLNEFGYDISAEMIPPACYLAGIQPVQDLGKSMTGVMNYLKTGTEQHRMFAEKLPYNFSVNDQTVKTEGMFHHVKNLAEIGTPPRIVNYADFEIDLRQGPGAPWAILIAGDPDSERPVDVNVENGILQAWVSDFKTRKDMSAILVFCENGVFGGMMDSGALDTDHPHYAQASQAREEWIKAKKAGSPPHVPLKSLFAPAWIDDEGNFIPINSLILDENGQALNENAIQTKLSVELAKATADLVQGYADPELWQRANNAAKGDAKLGGPIGWLTMSERGPKSNPFRK